MAISNRTRKILWAKSGNRCALCRRELVQSEIKEDDSYIIGEECHIISQKKNGPRGSNNLFCSNFDDYENLLLLCANDHIRIDTQVDIYPVEELVSLKKSHTNWVSTNLSEDPTIFANEKYQVVFLKRIESGSELVKIIDGANAYGFDCVDLDYIEEVNIIPPFLDLLKDYFETLEFMSFTDKAHLGLELTDYLKEIVFVAY